MTPKIQNRYGLEPTDAESAVSKLAKSQFEQLVGALSAAQGIALNERVKLLREMSWFLVDTADSLILDPVPAKVQFKYRSDKSITGIEFVKKYYGKFLGVSLTSGHIKKFDEYLYNTIIKERTKLGGEWPADFPMLSKQQLIDNEISMLSPNHCKKVLRLAKNISNRK